MGEKTVGFVQFIWILKFKSIMLITLKILVEIYLLSDDFAVVSVGFVSPGVCMF